MQACTVTLRECEMNTEKVTRVEVIDHRRESKEQGRVFTAWDDAMAIDLSLQDNGRTLKVFVYDRD